MVCIDRQAILIQPRIHRHVFTDEEQSHCFKTKARNILGKLVIKQERLCLCLVQGGLKSCQKKENLKLFAFLPFRFFCIELFRSCIYIYSLYQEKMSSLSVPCTFLILYHMVNILLKEHTYRNFNGKNILTCVIRKVYLIQLFIE